MFKMIKAISTFAISAAMLSDGVVARVPVYVMLPLDTVTNDNTIKDADGLKNKLSQLKSGGVEGVMCDCWWGLVEKSEQNYNFNAYLQLTQMVADAGLKMEYVMSFHSCGGNTGDECDIPLPNWVLNSSSDLWYVDQSGNQDKEYISLFVDEEAIVGASKRTPIQIYEDYMNAFKKSMGSFLSDTIVEVEVGCGPAGELRYPSYQLDKWSFCGVGEFQSYSSPAKAQLQVAADAAGHSDWGSTGGPSNAGYYNSIPSETDFFTSGRSNNYESDYGKFFLDWYTSSLVSHGSNVMGAASRAFKNTGIELSMKVSGVHWWYKHSSHAAELTAGYWNIPGTNDVYGDISQMLSKYNASFDFTCLEMQDNEQPSECACGPYELVQQTKQSANNRGINYRGENALQRYDQTAYDTMKSQSSNQRIGGLTYLRLTEDLLSNSNWDTFKRFVSDMNYI